MLPEGWGNSPMADNDDVLTTTIIPETDLKSNYEDALQRASKFPKYRYYILKKNGKEIRITEETTFEEVERA